MKVKIDEWHAVATWTWNAEDDACGICRHVSRLVSSVILLVLLHCWLMLILGKRRDRLAFDGCCPDCKMPGDDCPIGAYIACRAPRTSYPALGGQSRVKWHDHGLTVRCQCGDNAATLSTCTASSSGSTLKGRMANAVRCAAGSGSSRSTSSSSSRVHAARQPHRSCFDLSTNFIQLDSLFFFQHYIHSHSLTPFL
jgi:hypothetical protein